MRNTKMILYTIYEYFHKKSCVWSQWSDVSLFPWSGVRDPVTVQTERKKEENFDFFCHFQETKKGFLLIFGIAVATKIRSDFLRAFGSEVIFVCLTCNGPHREAGCVCER